MINNFSPNMMISKRQFVQGNRMFSHKRIVKTENLAPVLIATAIESLAIYKSLYEYRTHSLLVSSLLSSLSEHVESSSEFSQVAEEIIEEVRTGIDAQNMRIIDNLYTNRVFIDFLNRIGEETVSISSNKDLIRQTCNKFTIDLLLLKDRSFIRYRKIQGIKCFVYAIDSTFFILYPKISAYNEEIYNLFIYENCLLCSSSGSNECRSVCMNCFHINCKTEEICYYCTSKDIASGFMYCSSCKSQVDSINLILTGKHILCVSCGLSLLKQGSLSIEQKNYSISLKEKLLLYKLNQSKFEKTVNVLSCSICKDGKRTVCLCKCADCAVKYNFHKCPDCSEPIQIEDFCNFCFKGKIENMGVFGKFKICRSCFETKKKQLKKKKVKALVNHKKTKFKMNPSDFLAISAYFKEDNSQKCINCNEKAPNGCKCMCFSCSVAENPGSSYCRYCGMKIDYIRFNGKAYSHCKRIHNPNTLMMIENILICATCYANDLDKMIDTLETARNSKWVHLSRNNQMVAILGFQKVFPESLYFKCQECKKTKRIVCCLTCETCFKKKECNSCKGNICSKCNRKGKAACNCMCIFCARELKISACLSCLVVFEPAFQPNKCNICRYEFELIPFSSYDICANCTIVLIERYDDLGLIAENDQLLRNVEHFRSMVERTECSSFKYLEEIEAERNQVCSERVSRKFTPELEYF